MKPLRILMAPALALLLVLVAAPAALAGSGSISGTVRDGSGPVPGAVLTLFTAGGDYIADVSADGSGDFSFGGLAGGDYKLHVAGEMFGYVPEWYEDAPDFSSARRIAVPAGGTVGGLDVRVSAPYRIEGSVRTEDGQPITQARVEVRRSDTGEVVADTSTDDLGAFAIHNVPEGTYELWAGVDGGGFVPAAWEGNPAVIGPGGSVSGADIVLPAAPTRASVSGQVLLACSDGCTAKVYAVGPDGAVSAETHAVSSSGIAPFAFADLLPGGYRFVARCMHCDPGYYGGSSLQDAALLGLAAGDDVSGLVISLAHGSSTIEGTVRDAAGQPVAGATVEVFCPSGHRMRALTADAEGHFLAASLPSWEYTVRASDPEDQLETGYYGQPSESGRRGSPAQVSVPSGGSRAGVDITLYPVAAGVSGEVTKPDGSAAAGALVEVYSGTDVVARVDVDSNGRYRLGRLAPGTYRVKVSDPEGVYEPAWLAPADRPLELTDKAMAALHGALRPGRLASSLTWAARSRSVRRGSIATLVGRVRPGRSGVRVTLMRRASWGEHSIGTYTTDRRGRVRARIRVYQDLDLYWSWEGDARYLPSDSAVTRVRVSSRRR